MFQKIEDFLLGFFRRGLIATACLLTIGGILFYLYIGMQLLSSSPEALTKPSPTVDFEAPVLSPVEVQQQAVRLRDAKASFQSKYDDVETQIKQASRTSRNKVRDINQRFEELSHKPDYLNNPGKLTGLSSDKQKELEQACAEGNSRIDSEISSIKKSLLSVAASFNVDADDIKVKPEDELEKVRRMPSECQRYDTYVESISQNLSIAYPTNWGLGGEGTKGDLKKDVANHLEALYSELNDADYVNQFAQELSQYTGDLKSYYVLQQEELEAKNLFTTATAKTLAESITGDVRATFDKAYNQYKTYQNNSLLAQESASAKNAGYMAMLLSSTVIWLIVFGALILLIFAAMERHQRSLSSLKKESEKKIKHNEEKS